MVSHDLQHHYLEQVTGLKVVLSGYHASIGTYGHQDFTYAQIVRAHALMEELGIEVEIHELVESITHTYPEKAVQLLFFHCTWRRHEPQALGCAAIQWITEPQLDDYEFPAADSRRLEKLRSSAGLWQPAR